MSNSQSEPDTAVREEGVLCDAWNTRYEPGQHVRYWTGKRTGEGNTSQTRTHACMLGGLKAVLWVDGESACIALTHVEAITNRPKLPIHTDLRTTVAYIEQPMPTPNASPSVQGMVRDDLMKREQIGIQRYGTALQPNNGRDALRDAYEEALDLACYLRQAIAERDGEGA